MRTIDLALKDLAQIFRDRRSLLFLVAMPILFTLFMGFAYKSGDNGTASKDSTLALGWVNNDPQGLLSKQLFEQLSKSTGIKLVELDAASVHTPGAPDGVDVVRKGKVAGTLIVPAGFSAQLTSSGPGSPASQLTLIADLNTPSGQSLFQMLRVPLSSVMSSAEIARLSADSAGKPGAAAEIEQAFNDAAQAYAQADTAALVKVEMAVAKAQPAWYGNNPYNQASPGILVQFAIFGLVSSGQILVQERKTRTLQRMMTTSLRDWQIVAGHMLAMFTVVFLQVAMLVIFGQLVLGVNYAQAPLAVLIVSIALGLWIASLGLLIGVLVKNDSQVILFSLMAMFIFSAMGGSWFPLEVSSGAFAAIGKMLPSAWAMSGYQNILMRGLGLESAWLPVLALLAYTLGFFGLAVWRFRKLEA